MEKENKFDKIRHNISINEVEMNVNTQRDQKNIRKKGQ